MFSSEQLRSIEQHALFFINAFFALYVIALIYFEQSLTSFFYVLLISTFFLSYFFFKTSKLLSKMLILSNLLILFYFLSVPIARFLFQLFNINPFFLILIYTTIVAFVFLIFSGNHHCFSGSFKDFNLKLFSWVLLMSLIFSLIFIGLQEPIEGLILDVYSPQLWVVLLHVLAMAFLVALSEQLIFAAFFYNVYSLFVSKKQAMIYASLLFVLFHLTRFELISLHYAEIAGAFSWLYIMFYYGALFIFMTLSLYFYTFKTKEFSGIFLYPVLFHFIVDSFLFLQYYLLI